VVGQPGIAPVVPPPAGHYRPKVERAMAHVLPPRPNPLKNIMVMVIVSLVIAVFAGGLFAGAR
jgi:hypothetical protein